MEEAFKYVVQVAGAGIAIVPLFATVFVINAALQGLGKFGSVIGGIKGQGLRKRASDFRDRQEGRREINAMEGGKNLAFGKYKRRARREAIDSSVKAEATRARGSYIANEAISNESFRNKLAGGQIGGRNATPEATQRALASAINVRAKVEADEVTAANAVIKDLNLSQQQLQQLAMGNDAKDASGNTIAKNSQAMQAAAIQKQSQSTVSDINQLLDHAATGGMNPKAMQVLADSLQGSSAKPAYVGAKAIEDLRQGKASSSHDLAAGAINAGAYSKDKIATADKDEMQFVAHAAATNPRVAPAAKAKIQANASEALIDPILGTKIGKSETQVRNLSSGNDPGPL